MLEGGDGAAPCNGSTSKVPQQPSWRGALRARARRRCVWRSRTSCNGAVRLFVANEGPWMWRYPAAPDGSGRIRDNDVTRIFKVGHHAAVMLETCRFSEFWCVTSGRPIASKFGRVSSPSTPWPQQLNLPHPVASRRSTPSSSSCSVIGRPAEQNITSQN